MNIKANGWRSMLFAVILAAAWLTSSCCCMGGIDDDNIDLNLIEPDLIYPVAVVAAAPSTVADSLAVAFDASESYDTDGTIVQYDWDFDHDGTFDLLDGGATPDHTYGAAGEYQATVRVTDNDGLADSATTDAFTVPVSVSPPEAAGSAAQDSENPLLVNFDASDSFDSDGTIVQYDWDMDNDGTFELIDGGPNPSHTFPAFGTYTVGVRVIDNDGLSDSTTITFSLGAGLEPPTAILTATPDHGDAPGLEVTFDASGSTDSDGTIEQYDWDMDNDGTFEITDGGATQDVTYDAGGIYTVGVRVTDDDGLTDDTTADVDVNEPPVADLTATPDSGEAPLSVSYDASGSTDSDGTIEQYDWDMDNDGTFEIIDGGDSQNAEYDTPGTYTVAVQVTDDDGAMDTASAEVIVTAANQPPVAVINADPTAGVYPLDVDVDGLGSSDPDGMIIDYEWDFDGNGTYNEAGAEAAAQGDPGPHTLTFNDPGAFNVSLRVTDDGTPALTDTDTQIITVAGPDDQYSITVNITMSNFADWINHPSTLVRLYSGDPDDGGVPLAQFNADHAAAGDGNPATVLFESLSPGSEYYIRMQNTVMWWDGWPEPVPPDYGMIRVEGPFTIPPSMVLNYAGDQWREPPGPT